MLQSSRSMSSEGVAPSMVNGLDYLRDPKLFKGMAFSLEERQTLGIHGLLPPRIKSLDEQAENCMRNLRRFQVIQFLDIWCVFIISCVGSPESVYVHGGPSGQEREALLQAAI